MRELASEMELRYSPSRASRLGTRRRRAKRAVPEAGAPSSGRKAGAHSLDTEKVLATSVRDWADSQATEEDYRAEQLSLQRQLLSTVHEIWQGYARAGQFDLAAKWEKTWLQLYNCQSQWIAYRAACCGAKTAPVAVPIGCNHRLCPICAYHRSTRARGRIKSMFDRLTHPALITFTVPSKGSVRKHDYTLMRQKIRKFIAQHRGVLGGIYSLETTFNRAEKTWHLHAHVLADLAAALPTKAEKVTLAGERVYAFTAMKLRIEFDWLRLWSRRWGTIARKGASKMRLEGDTYEFEEWVRMGRANRLKEWREGSYKPILGLSSAELAARMAWNKANRRVLDLRPVVDREGAAREVLKYITKVADFCDLTEAVEPFCDAVKGVRLVQTFGTWYGFNPDVLFDPEHLESWGEMKCTCGLNHWERIRGAFSREDVVMDAAGHWALRKGLDHNSRGTIARPTIRALDSVPEESEDSQLCQMERR